MRVRKVPRQMLEAAGSASWVDLTRSPYVDGDTAWVPVKDGEPFDQDLPERHRYRGRGYYMIGDVAILHGDEPGPDGVNEIVAFKKPRGILWIESLDDVMRLPKTHLLYGESGEVTHRESGYTYVLDPALVMFSQGNREEKARMAALVRASPAGHRVADMFAGIGYFTIPMAGAGARVHAMELNPVSFGYLQRNIVANGLLKIVTPELGDCRNLLHGTYDRIVMGHFDAVRILPLAIPHVHSGSIIHVHSIGPVTDEIRTLAEGAGFSVSIQVHKVKKYRPHIWHIVQDVKIG